MSWRTQGLYLHRTRKPHAVVGLGLRWLVPAAVALAWLMWALGDPWWLAPLLLLFSGRHTAYVGQTSSRYFRDSQHQMGSTKYGTPGAAWSDLDLKIYPLPCLFPRSVMAREIQEKLWIFLLLPVYNVEWNSKNPRRIKRTVAINQRIARTQKSARMWVPRVLRGALLLAVLGGAGSYVLNVWH